MEGVASSSFGKELSFFFPHVDPDVADAVFMSCDRNVSLALSSLDCPVPTAASGSKVVSVGSLVQLDGVSRVVIGPQGESLGEFGFVFVFERFGSYLVGTDEIFASSATYEYATACDDLTDALYFASWDGKMTERLENALLQLLAECEDSLQTAVDKMRAMTAMMGGGNDMDETVKTVNEDLSKALVDHSQVSIGRLHSTLHQLLQVSRMFPLPASLVAAIKEFEASKNTSGAVAAALVKANSALDNYGSVLMKSGLGPTDGYLQALLRQKQQLVATMQSNDLSNLWQFSTGLQMQALSQDAWHPNRQRASFFPVIPREALLDQGLLLPLVNVYTETLSGGGVLMLGSLMQYRMGANSAEQNAAVMHSLVSAGLGYAGSGSGGALVALHGHNRASLFLNDRPCLPEKFLSRRKDCCRQLRKIARERPDARLSLRCSTMDLDESVQKLREQHSDNNWADKNVVMAWRELQRQGKFCVMELFEDDLLIAADFCHLIDGGAIYVATRYSNRDKGALSPGFLMSLASVKEFCRRGATIWDLGQTDRNPIMAYKSIVSRVLPRAVIMRRLGQNKGTRAVVVAPGELIHSLKEDDLMNE